jgi:KTSC domain
MEYISVTSSNLRSVAYDEDDEMLEIIFKDGGTYRYHALPAYIYQNLMNALSKGKYFHQHIKDRYRTTKVR